MASSHKLTTQYRRCLVCAPFAWFWDIMGHLDIFALRRFTVKATQGDSTPAACGNGGPPCTWRGGKVALIARALAWCRPLAMLQTPLAILHVGEVQASLPVRSVKVHPVLGQVHQDLCHVNSKKLAQLTICVGGSCSFGQLARLRRPAEGIRKCRMPRSIACKRSGNTPQPTKTVERHAALAAHAPNHSKKTWPSMRSMLTRSSSSSLGHRLHTFHPGTWHNGLGGSPAMYSSLVIFLSSGCRAAAAFGKHLVRQHKAQGRWHVQGAGSWHQAASSRQSA